MASGDLDANDKQCSSEYIANHVIVGDEIFICIVIYRTSEFHMVGCLGLG